MSKHIIIINASDISDGRKVLESIEGDTFSSYQELNDAIGIDREKYALLSLTDFLTDWNDTDDTKQHLDIANSWIGYIELI